MIRKFMKKMFYNHLGAFAPKWHIIMLWIIWYIGSVYFFEFLLSKEMLSGNSSLGGFLLGTVPVIVIFSDKRFIVNQFSEYRNKIVKVVYAYNLVFLFTDVFLKNWVLNDYLNFDFSVRVSAELVYWMSTIFLAVVYDTKKWVVLAAFVFTNSILYLLALQKLSNLVDTTSILYIVMTVGVMCTVSLISIYIFKIQINKIFRV